MCIEASDVIDFPIKDCTAAELCCSEEQIDARIAEAIDIVEQITGQWICPRDKCITIRGNKTTKLFFPPQIIAPAIEIESVTHEGTAISWDYDVFAHFLEGEQCFPCCKYEVCGSWGYAEGEIPAMLKRAIIILALELLSPGITGYVTPTGVSRADWEDFSISWRVDETQNVFGRSTGIRYIDNILANYMNHSGMFLMASSNCPETCCGDCGEGSDVCP